MPVLLPEEQAVALKKLGERSREEKRQGEVLRCLKDLVAFDAVDSAEAMGVLAKGLMGREVRLWVDLMDTEGRLVESQGANVHGLRVDKKKGILVWDSSDGGSQVSVELKGIRAGKLDEKLVVIQPAEGFPGSNLVRTFEINKNDLGY